MIACPTCGNENPDGSRFCSNCGTALTMAEAAPAVTPPPGDPTTVTPSVPVPPTPAAEPVGNGEPVEDAEPVVVTVSTGRTVPPMPEPRTWAPPPTTAASPTNALPATAPDWRMSDAGPLPEPRGRRRWLWILVGILGACLLVCVGLTIWGNTESGTRVLNDWATSVAEAATPRAGTATAGD